MPEARDYDIDLGLCVAAETHYFAGVLYIRSNRFDVKGDHHCAVGSCQDRERFNDYLIYGLLSALEAS